MHIHTALTIDIERRWLYRAALTHHRGFLVRQIKVGAQWKR
jgi:hypothetical protein